MVKRQMLLLVEDDAELRGLYRETLADEGFEVREAGDGLEALIEIDNALPDLIVLDLMLPRISGHAILREIAASAYTRNVPVLVVTGSTESLNHRNIVCLLRKPVAMQELVDAVYRCLAHVSRPDSELMAPNLAERRSRRFGRDRRGITRPAQGGTRTCPDCGGVMVFHDQPRLLHHEPSWVCSDPLCNAREFVRRPPVNPQ